MLALFLSYTVGSLYNTTYEGTLMSIHVDFMCVCGHVVREYSTAHSTLVLVHDRGSGTLYFAGEYSTLVRYARSTLIDVPTFQTE